MDTYGHDVAVLVTTLLQSGVDVSTIEQALGNFKQDVWIDSRELRDDEGTYRFKVGDAVTGYVKSLEDGIWLTTALPKGAQREALIAARESGMPVEGTVRLNADPPPWPGKYGRVTMFVEPPPLRY